MAAWSALTGAIVRPWEIRALLAIDDAYLESAAEDARARERKAPPPVKPKPARR